MLMLLPPSVEMMAIKRFLLVCVCWCVSMRTVAAEEEIGSPLRIAQCRAHCVLKFSKEPQKQEMCFKEPDCLMCWENCQLLQANFPIWGGICSEAGICFPGCQEACRFHREISPQQQSVPVIRTRGEEVIFVKNNTAFWPRPTHVRHGDADPVVYVVMRRLPGRMWRQIIQTLDTTSRVPEDLSSGALLRVLVVDSEGLFTIYSPIAAESSLRSANDIARSSGQVNLNTLLSNATTDNRVDGPPMSSGQTGHRINTEITRTWEDGRNSTDEETEYTLWNLREISLIHQKVLVIAEIAWDAVPTHVLRRPVYFVTWEVDGGGLKGNLFTDSTCVTLSLWPDTVYHIQVELVGHNVATGRAQQSEDFLLDTHRAVAVELETSSSNMAVLSVSEVPVAHDVDSNEVSAEITLPAVPHRIEMLADQDQYEILFAVVAAFGLFFLVLAVLVYASCRHGDMLSYPRTTMDIFSLRPSKESSIDCSKFPKDIVPILTMVSEQVSNTEPLRPSSCGTGSCYKQSSRRFGDDRRSRSCPFESTYNLHGVDKRFDGCSAKPVPSVSSWRPYVCDNAVDS